MNIDGIPESVDWAKVNDFLLSIGIDVRNCLLAGVRIAWNVVECEVYLTDDDGRHYLVNAGGDEIAMHKVSIPVVHAAASEQSSAA